MGADAGMAGRLHHVAIVVSDIGQAVAWYRDSLAPDVIYQDESWAMLRFANIDLALVLPGKHPPHLAVERADAATYGALTRHRDGSESVYIKDPFGNVIEVMQSRGME